jgi:uncharacterized protein YggE
VTLFSICRPFRITDPDACPRSIVARHLQRSSEYSDQTCLEASVHRTLVLASLIAAIGVTAPSLAGSQSGSTPQPPQIVVSGEASVNVTPDKATTYVGVQSRATTAAAAASDNARRQRAIIDTLKALGIPADQITTQNYSVSPEMQFDPERRGSPRVTGYVVSNVVRVELRRIDQIGPVIDAALAKGANQINGVEFSVSNVDDARRSALAQAVARARADAEALARAAGGSLGALVELSSSGPVYRPVFAAARMETMATAQTPIEPGLQSVSASVSARWLFVSANPGR